MPAVPQEQHRRELLAELRAVDDRARSLVAGLDRARLEWKPPDGGWSIAQVLEHLCVSSDSYIPALTTLIQDADTPRAGANALWRPSLMGGWLAESLRPKPTTRKLPAPRKYRVGGRVRPNVVEEFLVRQRSVAELLERAAHVDWTRARLRSPVLPILRMNLGDAFTVIVVHDQRHLGQIERVRQRGEDASWQ